MSDEFLLAEIAKLYYIDKVKQNEIAKRYGFNAMYVSRLLRKAEDLGLVKFIIKMPFDLDLELGKKIKNKYGLKECIVLNVAKDEDIRDKIGQFAADYVLSLIQNGNILGVSWGKTIYYFAKHLSNKHMPDCKVLQLAGGFMTEEHYLISPNHLIKTISEKFNCVPWFLNAPFIVSSEDARNELLEDATNKYIFELAEKADINIIGSSSLKEDSTIFEMGALDLKDREEMLQKGAIGEIGGFPIDINGNEVIWSKTNLVTGVPLATIKKAKYVICLSGEADKSLILKAAMKKKYFNILITTREAANRLLI